MKIYENSSISENVDHDNKYNVVRYTILLNCVGNRKDYPVYKQEILAYT